MWLFFYSEFLWAISSALLPTVIQVTIRILQKKRWQSKAQRLKEFNYLISKTVSKTTQFQKLWSRPKTKDLKKYPELVFAALEVSKFSLN